MTLNKMQRSNNQQVKSGRVLGGWMQCGSRDCLSGCCILHATWIM